jgi:hypothetical protein
MDREQATEIHRHLMTAARAISRAEKLTFDLGKEGRAAFAEPLGKVVQTLPRITVQDDLSSIS